jgi:hypothetical protein
MTATGITMFLDVADTIAGFYGPEQTAPEDAATMDRLAAFTGRPL